MNSQLFKLISGLFLVVFITGCSSTRVIYQDKSFTRESLKQGRMAFGGVTALGGGEYIAADELCEVVQRNFQARKPWLETVPLSSTRHKFAAGEYESFLKRVSENGRWSEEDLNRFQCASNLARYVLIIDVVKANEISTDRMVSRYDYDPVFGSSPYDYDMVKGGRRSVRAIFILRDLESGKTVWIVSGSASASAYKSQKAFLSMYRSLEGPGVPSIVEVMDPIAKRVSKRLP